MMKLIISDSCSLILLEKSKILKIFLKYNQIIIPNAVYEETVINGMRAGYSDAKEINNYIKSKSIVVKKVKKILNIKMDSGEKEAISLYLELNANLLLTDDKQAITFCKIKDINYVTTPEIIYKMYLLKRINKKMILSALKTISEEGWYKPNIIIKYYDMIIGD